MKRLQTLILSFLILSWSSILAEEHFETLKRSNELVIVDPINEDLSYHMINLSHDLTTSKVQSGSRISRDGEKLYFFIHDQDAQGDEMRGQEIAVSQKKENGEWTEATLIDELNNRDHNGVHYVSKDNNRLLLLSEYLKNGTSTRGVSMTERLEDGTWSDPEPLKIKGYHNDDICSFYMNDAEEVLLLAVNHRDTYGLQDIYVSFKQGKHWTKPLNLGPIVNTESSEGAMSLSDDGKTLYFSSNSMKDGSYGGYDIYKTERLDDSWTNWSEPENLGFPYNTPEDELYYTFSPSDDYAYLSRHFLENGEEHHSDIIAIKKYVEKSNVDFVVMAFDAETQEEITATVKLVETVSASEAVFGAYEIHPVEKNESYEIIVSAEGFVSSKDRISIFDEDGMNVHLSFLQPKREGVKWEIENVFFEFDDSELLPTSYAALDNVVEVLTREKDLLVEISGHTDMRGNDSYNFNLSDKRAESVVSYLVSAGIDQSRLKHQGYGEQKPINECKNDKACSEEEHQQNRRVEFEIIGLTTNQN